MRFAKLVCLLIAALLGLTSCRSIYEYPLPGGADVGDNPMEVKIMFRDVLDLVPASTVKVNDVTVGRVASIELVGNNAQVTVVLPGNVKLPDNAEAKIRQTSLLGEKFVSLNRPASGASSNLLGDGDVIGLDNTGRNPEVEEVLGALSLLLNGGGVAQIRTISRELGQVMDGNVGEIRALFSKVRRLMVQLNQNKGSIVQSIDAVNRLSIQLKKQDGAIKSALNNLPKAVASLGRQRKNLVKLLLALQDLSSVGVRVVRASKSATIDTLQDLLPVLTQLSAAGQDLPKSLQVILTFPFVDAAVGGNPTVAKNLHMGDFTNLSLRLEVNEKTISLPFLQNFRQAVAGNGKTARPGKPRVSPEQKILNGPTGSSKKLGYNSTLGSLLVQEASK